VGELVAMGLPVRLERIFSTAWSARTYLLSRGLTRCHLLVAARLLPDLDGIVPTDQTPDAVVVGDAAEGFSYERLNTAFRLVLGGAELVALARNRYFRKNGELVLDCGPFVAALEEATGRRAVLTGKPSPLFFEGVLTVLGLAPAEVAMIGDDLESDVRGAQRAGLKGILVKTGKWREGDLDRPGPAPDAVLPSLADLPGLLS
jgi:HAD superfamily hydrolase (TIGR01458 family)